MPEGRYCKEWAVADTLSLLPSDRFLTAFIIILTLTALVLAAAVKTLRKTDLHALLQNAGVAVNKVARTAWEIDRKLFKLTGLGVPMIHQILLWCGFANSTCTTLCWSVTIVWVVCDVMRLYVPFVRRILDLVFKEILRKEEQDQLSGASYFLIGCALTIQFFAPAIAMTAIIFLVIGVLCAALVARSFGQSAVNVGAGPSGQKSIEGSAAMFIVCFAFGCTIFHRVYLREYSVFGAALVATIVEFYEPLRINYNVSIPVLTALALSFGFERTQRCSSLNPLFWFSSYE